jgi:hypothetical protein
MPTEDGYDTLDELSDDGEQEREIYARYGLAMYAAQVLEEGASSLIVVHEMTHGNMRVVEEVGERFEELWTKTLGALIRQVGVHQLVTADQSIVLRDALKARNRLAHHFFREEAESFVTPGGKRKMLDQLDAARHRFEEASALAADIYLRYMSKYGVTRETIGKMVDEMTATARARDAAEGA